MRTSIPAASLASGVVHGQLREAQPGVRLGEGAAFLGAEQAGTDGVHEQEAEQRDHGHGQDDGGRDDAQLDRAAPGVDDAVPRLPDDPLQGSTEARRRQAGEPRGPRPCLASQPGDALEGALRDRGGDVAAERRRRHRWDRSRALHVRLRSRGSGLVADAADRYDDLRTLRVGFHLRAQPLHVHVDQPGVGGVPVTPRPARAAPRG